MHLHATLDTQTTINQHAADTKLTFPPISDYLDQIMWQIQWVHNFQIEPRLSYELMIYIVAMFGKLNTFFFFFLIK